MANLEFRETSGKADINIKFAYGVHGDGQYNAFDGQGSFVGLVTVRQPFQSAANSDHENDMTCSHSQSHRVMTE